MRGYVIGKILWVAIYLLFGEKCVTFRVQRYSFLWNYANILSRKYIKNYIAALCRFSISLALHLFVTVL